MKLVTLASCVALTAAFAGAQAEPGITRPMARSPLFDIAKPPFSAFGTGLETVSCQKLSVDSPGIHTVSLTIRQLVAAYGGNGRRLGVIIGKYDVRQRTFTPTTQGNAINDTAYHHYNLHVEPGPGLIAVCDRLDAASSQAIGVVLATRGTATSAFSAAGPVTGIQGTIEGGYDAAVGRIGGVPHLFYHATIGGQQGIWIDALDLTAPAQPKVLGQPRLVVRKEPAWTNVHSATPLAGGDGDVEGLWCARRIGGDSDMTFAEDLDPDTPLLLTLDNALWMNNGGIAGGTLLCADQAYAYLALTEAAGCWLLGDVEKVGGKADLLAGAAGGTATHPVVTALFLSAGVAAWPAFPGIHGRLGLLVSPLLTLGAVVHDGDDLARLTVQIPNQPGLANQRFAIQGLAIGTAQPTVLAFTNHAWIVVR